MEITCKPLTVEEYVAAATALEAETSMPDVEWAGRLGALSMRLAGIPGADENAGHDPRYLEVAKRLIERYKRVVIHGTEAEKKECHQITMEVLAGKR